ncbi:Dolichyl-P-Glc:Glc1Man9GlcNAc2-PP-dolichyl glucosyltransferase ALG8, family GT57 [Ectocarpus siliculosus]|uniref:Alpha-1,3-glucosyltransferase n=1 Tax=Ectocarpus siliculosus TaxID=2880 RepID=D7G161_ECTSI|nr:Dolichyl-P-Glc:Glc1Man9GlcNAc2-PP-dolichyl glucosyltransferase ALG8, family GT57 [Ectocarpus siliculosus]|eukprot:CBJ33171.1 Dolichyl-P-Glc:Glc1Man9GlcNAc2-PP-dolichyl glucosyltransferase ALG8, family GT57 [Ectocarpus siliculosus]
MLFGMASLIKLLVLAPCLYRSTDFEVHRNWLAITHSKSLVDWYWEDTSEWTLDYPPLFGYFQWALSQAAVHVEPDLVKITPYYEPSEVAVWFQRVSVMVVDVTMVLGVVAWCKGARMRQKSGGVHSGTVPQDVACATCVGPLVLLNSGLFLVDHVHFQYNGFLLGLLLLSMGLIRQGRVLSGGATFAGLLMLKHLFLALAPLYFVYLLRSYCCGASAQQLSKGVGGSGDVRRGGESSVGEASQPPERGDRKDLQRAVPSVSHEQVQAVSREDAPLARLSWKRLASLGSAVLFVFGSVLGPLCVSDGWTKDACLKQLGQLGVRLFPFGRGLVHAYWAPNVWAVYLFLDRVLLASLKLAGLAAVSDGKGSTTGGLVRTEIMAILPSVPTAACLFLSVLACWPAFVRAWKTPSAQVFAWGVVHCSLSAFLVGFHVHEKALLVPAVVSALLASHSRAGARMYLRLSFLAAFAVFPLLPGPELRVLKVVLLITHLMLATSLLEHRHAENIKYEGMAPTHSRVSERILADHSSERSPSSAPGEPSRKASGSVTELVGLAPEQRAGAGVGRVSTGGKCAPAPCLWTGWDKAYVAGAGVIFVLGEVVHPLVFQEGTLPFLPLMGVSVFGAVGVMACWGLSVSAISTTVQGNEEPM